MTTLRVSFVDVYVVRLAAAGGLEFLLLRRAYGGRSPGSWEGVHGHLVEGEAPITGAVRELDEETGLRAERLYNLSRVESFYLAGRDEIALAPVLVALVPSEAPVRLSPEHDASEWLGPAAAAARATWPRARRAVHDIVALLGTGDAGPVEDVLRLS